MKVRFLHPAIGEFAVHLRPTGDTVVGRAGAEADIEITWDRRISRRHARLWVNNGVLWFEDLGSRNGSWQGQSRLDRPIEMSPGSSVLMGETALIVPESQEEGPKRDVERTYEAPAPRGLSMAIAATQTHPQLYLGEIVRTEDRAHTMDLRSPLEDSTSDIPIEEVVEDPYAPRFVAPDKVQVKAERAYLAHLWTKELSKGGLYVQTPDAPAVGARVEVRVGSEDGEVSFNAQVVSVVAPAQAQAFQMPPGAGLQLTDLSGPKKASLKAYIDGTAPRLGEAAAIPSGAANASVDAALDRARRLLSRADDDKLYEAVGSTSTATGDVLGKTLDELQHCFQSALPLAKPPQAARLQAALTVLDRIRRTLGRPEARMEYDFRAGYVNAKERLAAAREGSGPDVATLRRVWNRVQPDKVDEAARLTRKAFAARQEHDLEKAVRYGERAMEMNPFFEELKKTVEAWQRTFRGDGARVGRRKPPARTPPGPLPN